MKKLIILTIVFPTLITSAWAQATDPDYRQFFFNPYLYNSAFVGVNNQPELSLVHKRHWINFNDAPKTIGINLQIPTNDRVALGFNLISDSRIVLRNTSFTGTFGYVVPIDEKQSLRFGLSGGIGVKKLDLTAEELNTNDPAILSAASTNYYINGNFGFVYTYGGLRVGVALTELFKSDPYETETFNEFSISNLQNRLFSLSYRFKLDPLENFTMEPYALYKQSADGLQDSWEAASVIYYKNHLWSGLSYHEDRGLGLFFGLNHKDKFSFSYAYEFPPFKSEGLSYSSHELQMSLKFGTKKDGKKNSNMND